jgi:hypothetical protein
MLDFVVRVRTSICPRPHCLRRTATLSHSDSGSPQGTRNMEPFGKTIDQVAVSEVLFYQDQVKEEGS